MTWLLIIVIGLALGALGITALDVIRTVLDDSDDR